MSDPKIALSSLSSRVEDRKILKSGIFLRRLSSPVVGALEPQIGNRCHSAATTETTGFWLASHRAFDLQQRHRLR